MNNVGVFLNTTVYKEGKNTAMMTLEQENNLSLEDWASFVKFEEETKGVLNLCVSTFETKRFEFWVLVFRKAIDDYAKENGLELRIDFRFYSDYDWNRDAIKLTYEFFIGLKRLSIN